MMGSHYSTQEQLPHLNHLVAKSQDTGRVLSKAQFKSLILLLFFFSDVWSSS